MMQETDQCYGSFKTQFLKNLDMIVEARVKNSKSLLIALKMVGFPLCALMVASKRPLDSSRSTAT